jgi:DNA-binding transcriptional ArsR family regulator
LTIDVRGTILKHVLNDVADLDRVFPALSGPGRRLTLERLDRGPASVSELGRPLSMSLATVVQHAQVLETSGLVRTRKLGRVRTCRLTPVTLRSAERWMSERRAVVEQRLDRLGQYLAGTGDPPGAGTADPAAPDNPA